MIRLSRRIVHWVFLFLALLSFMSGSVLPDYLWSRRGFAQATSPQVTNAGWSLTGSLNTGRFLHTATLLPNGKVLVAGGYQGGATETLNSAELYDSATGRWSSTGNLNTARGYHTATLLPNGKVLVAGGHQKDSFQGTLLNSAELYDPTTGNWSSTGNLMEALRGHTTTLLPNGKVLVAGGYHNGVPETVDRAELYDPATGRWSSTGNLNTARVFHTATVLPNGKVLVAGGYHNGYTEILNSAELYDSATGRWSSTGNLNTARALHTATLLSNGKLLVVAYGISGTNTSAELYAPVTGTWSATGSLNFFAVADGTHTATLLSDGNVLVTGFFNYNDGYLRRSDLYDPATGMWIQAGILIGERSGHTATLLPNGRVLVAGGAEYQFTLDSTALFDAGLPQTGTVSSVSAASFSPSGLTSEAITSSFGANLATGTQRATTIPLPTSLGGTTVKINDSAGIERLAALFFVSSTQVNYQIPPGTAVGMATVTITNADGTVSTGVVQINPVAPSLFAANADGRGVPAAFALRVKTDGSQSYEAIAQFDDAQNKFIARALDLGPEGEQVYLVLWGTGIRHRTSLTSVIATVGGTFAEVSFAGAQGEFVGLDQVNVLVPRSLAGRGEIEVLLTVEARMANPVRIQLK